MMNDVNEAAADVQSLRDIRKGFAARHKEAVEAEMFYRHELKGIDLRIRVICKKYGWPVRDEERA